MANKAKRQAALHRAPGKSTAPPGAPDKARVQIRSNITWERLLGQKEMELATFKDATEQLGQRVQELEAEVAVAKERIRQLEGKKKP